MNALLHFGVPGFFMPKSEVDATVRALAISVSALSFRMDACFGDAEEKESSGYNREAVEQAIKSSERRGGKVSGKERQAIHALLKGWRGDDATKAQLSAIIDSMEALDARMDACFAPHVIPQK